MGVVAGGTVGRGLTAHIPAHENAVPPTRHFIHGDMVGIGVIVAIATFIVGFDVIVGVGKPEHDHA